MQRGEVWWADLPPPLGRRPVLLVSRTGAILARTLVTVAPITRTVHRLPIEVPLDERDGMPVPCVVNLDNIVTVPKNVLIERITALSHRQLDRVRTSILIALDLRDDG